MTKLEQVARAIWAKFEENPDYARLQMNAIVAEELARAAIEAMREPTNEMLWAHEVPHYGPDEARDAWHAMIDSILNEREG